jgi:adenosylhomocysteine nucleosidase
MIAILVAVKQELTPILDRAADCTESRQEHLDFYEGRLGRQPVAILALGVGKECARIAAEITVRCYRPDLIISAGFGGALTPEVRDGDIVVGTDILELEADLGGEVRCRSELKTDTLHGAENLRADFRVHYGPLLTTEEMILTAAAKARIGRATQALSVDMETSAVAAVCRAHHTGFLGVRSITDDVREDLPEEFNDFFVVGQLQAGRIMSSLVRRPVLLVDLCRLGYRAARAGRNLARFLESSLPQLSLPAMRARQAV